MRGPGTRSPVESEVDTWAACSTRARLRPRAAVLFTSPSCHAPRATGAGQGGPTMIATDVEPALHWRCPSCGLEWVEPGNGFHGHRFSECLRCGCHAREG